MERRTCRREFKGEAVKLIRAGGVTVAHASRELGVQGTVLRRWVQECAADAPQALPGQGQMKPEQAALARLRREVLQLTAARDIFKKAAASCATEVRGRSSSSRHTGGLGRRDGYARRAGSRAPGSMPGELDRRGPERRPTHNGWPGCEPASSPATGPTARGVSGTTCWRTGPPAADIGSSG